ncbi:MAG: CopG family transcriptional regulator [Deltaproteobacteria bacterium]|nr:CopG family transcriptional regulator [Deltaproteobacteria bacterium]
MDRALENADLSAAFAQRGVLRQSRMRKINLDLPEGIVRQIDQIADRVGVARQPLLKIWIHERLKVEGTQ